MPDVDSIPFRKADGSGHYKSKQLPNDSGEFLEMLGLPAVAGDVNGPGSSTTGQVAIFDDNTGTRLNTTSITGLATLSVGVLGSTPKPSGVVVGTTDAQTLTNKTLLNPVITGLTGLTKADVGLGNVDNTSDATKNSAVATLTNKTLTAPVINSPTGLVKADVGLANVDNTSDANKPISTAQATVNTAKEDKANKGVNSGYASLDSSGKVPIAQIPDAVVGASVYQGTWNAATNSPAIPAAAVGNKGWYYSVAVAGTTNINGINSWAVGDQIISNGTVWQKIPNADAVNSVNGQTGVVVLTKSDVGLGNVDNTSDAAKPVSTATATALGLKQDTAGKGAVNGYAGLDSGGKVPTAQLPASAMNAGTVVGPGTTVAAEIASYADTTGNLLARITPPAGALVGTTATQTLTGKTLTAPTINNAVMTTPTGITKADVGLANVDNTSDATKNSASATLTNKTINGANNTLTVRLDADVTNNLPTSRLNSGTGANSGSFWRGDGQWAPPAGGGDVVGPGAAVDGDVTVFNGTTGKVIKTTGKQLTALVTGPATATSGNIATFNGTTGKIIQDGGDLTAVAKPIIWSVAQLSYNATRNSNFEVDQMNCGVISTNAASGLFVQDRWQIFWVGSMRFSAQQVQATVASGGIQLSNNCQRLTLTTAQGSLGAGDYCMLLHSIEGSVLRELASGVTSISLMVRSSVANLKFSVAITDDNGTNVTRSIVHLCTMGTANTWTLITLPNIPVFDAGGHFALTPGSKGGAIGITVAAGTTFSTTTGGSWKTGVYYGATGMDNFASKATNSTFDVGFVQFEPGSACGGLIDVPFNENLQSCQRYYYKTYNYNVVPGTATMEGLLTGWANTTWSGPVGAFRFPVSMAKVPSVYTWASDGTPGAFKEYAGSGLYGVTGVSGLGANGFTGLNSAGSMAAPTMLGFHYHAQANL